LAFAVQETGDAPARFGGQRERIVADDLPVVVQPDLDGAAHRLGALVDERDGEGERLVGRHFLGGETLRRGLLGEAFDAERHALLLVGRRQKSERGLRAQQDKSRQETIMKTCHHEIPLVTE
jgi:hypothetical protein